MQKQASRKLENKKTRYKLEIDNRDKQMHMNKHKC
jgi:hypothetical protein